MTLLPSQRARFDVSREKLHAVVSQLASGLFGGDVEGYAVVSAARYGLSSAARAIESIVTKP